MRWRDRIVGIVLGVILGIGIVAAFVLALSEQTVDAPSLSGPGRGGAVQPGGGGGPPEPPVADVRVIGGVPPPSGPAELRYRRGDLVRLRVISDGTVRIALPGYRVERAVPAGKPVPIRFRASKRGNFSLLVVPSQVAVAQLRVGGPAA